MNILKSTYYSTIGMLSLFLLGFVFPLNPTFAQIANVSVDIPTPHGGDLGTIAGGIAFQSRTRNTPKGFNPDGNVGASFGLGDSRNIVGVSVNVNVFGLSSTVGEDNNFGSGTMDLQINRSLNDYIFIGAGVRNLLKWKSPEPRARNNRSYYLTSNFIIPLHRRYNEPFSLFFLTAGIGNGMFRLDKDFSLNTSGKFNVFGSMALQVFRGGNVIFEWNGFELNAGLSVYPFKKIPALGGTFAITDLTEERTRFIFSMGYSIRI